MTWRFEAKRLALFSAFVALTPRSLWACAACYGQSDSAMAAGMNWGIFSLLGMIVLTLGGVAGFFVYLARRSVARSPDTLAAVAASWDASWPSTAEQPSVVSEQDPFARGGLKRESNLARQRKHCAHATATIQPIVPPRGRS